MAVIRPMLAVEATAESDTKPSQFSRFQVAFLFAKLGTVTVLPLA